MRVRSCKDEKMTPHEIKIIKLTDAAKFLLGEVERLQGDTDQLPRFVHEAIDCQLDNGSTVLQDEGKESLYREQQILMARILNFINENGSFKIADMAKFIELLDQASSLEQRMDGI